MAKDTKAGFGEVLRVPEFRAMLLAELFSIVGDQLARVALALLVFQRTDSAALTALTYALTFVPSVLGGALLSGLADRYTLASSAARGTGAMLATTPRAPPCCSVRRESAARSNG